MSQDKIKSTKPQTPLANQGDAYCKLSLVSTLLFYISHDDLELSSSAFLGMSIVVDEVAESLINQEEKPKVSTDSSFSSITPQRREY